MAAPTAKGIAVRLLREGLGVRSLDATSPTDQANAIESGDLDDIAGVMTQAFQEIDDLSPDEARQRPASAYLNAPTDVTLTATNGSTTISVLTTYAAWQLGCTIRIDGDDQDNELITQTTLARPYMGASGSGKAAKIYGDCVQLDETVGEIMGPMVLSGRTPIMPVFTREEFLRLGNYPLFTDASGNASIAGLPFYYVSRKPISNRPTVYFVDSLYTATLDYVPRKIRFSPMPSEALSIGYSAGMNPIRIAATDIDNGDHTTDPGVKLPTIDGKVESIFMPIALQILSRHPKFKNEAGKAEIARSYRMAVGRLENSRGSRGPQFTRFH